MGAKRTAALCAVAAAVSIALLGSLAPSSASGPQLENGLIVFASTRGGAGLSIFTMRADGSAVHRLTRSEQTIRTFEPSPDGAMIAYVAKSVEDVQSELYVSRRDGTKRIFIAGEAEGEAVVAFDQGMSWSPNGRRLAFSAQARIWLVSRRGGRPRMLTVGTAPRWSPTGRRIAFIRREERGGPSLRVIGVDGSGLRQLARATAHEGLSDLRWSPDGHRLVFTRISESGESAVHVIDLIRQRRVDLGRGGSPEWSPNGRQIALVRYQRRYYGRIFVVNRDGSGNRQLTRSSDDDREPSWSPDGGRIAFTRRGRSLHIVSPRGGAPRRLFGPKESALSQPRWIGRDRLAFGYGQAVYETTVPAGQARQLFGGGVPHASPAWSPDGWRVAFSMGDDVYTVTPGGDPIRVKASGPDPSWSPDGEKIATTNAEVDGVTVYTLADGSRETILWDEGAGDPSKCCPAWAPDLGRIAYANGVESPPGRLAIFRFGLRGVYLGHEVSTGWSHLRWGSWSPDGERIVFASPSPAPSLSISLFVINADGSGKRRIARNAAQPAWSPDGRLIAFVRPPTGNTDIWVMNANGSGQRRLTRNPGADMAPSWQRAP